MKIIKNEKLIKRNGQIGGWLFFGALIAFGGSLFLFYQQAANSYASAYYLGIFLIAFFLVLIGTNLVDKYGGTPRPDEKLDAALKGLPGDYMFYHSTTPAIHLLVGPAGIWSLHTYRQSGVKISYSKNRWRISGGGFVQMYMRLFGQGGIGRPDIEADNDIRALRKALKNSMAEDQIPEINIALIFFEERVDLQTDGAPFPALKIKQLKDFIRQKAKEKPISQTQLAAVKAAFPE